MEKRASEAASRYCATREGGRGQGLRGGESRPASVKRQAVSGERRQSSGKRQAVSGGSQAASGERRQSSGKR
eukprot:7385188-Prymnesium_polylepis.4